MTRYFLELSYHGAAYSGFQTQQNAHTVQAEVEKAFNLVHGLGKDAPMVEFTGSSRTDAGVHALQNFFHFDMESPMHPQAVYKMNSVLPRDISVKRIVQMPPAAHSRFDATSRRYIYKIHRYKDPFLQDRSLYFPYSINETVLHQAAALIKKQNNFFPFSKTNTQVKNFICEISVCDWAVDDTNMQFTIEANRFLRGMVRLITATCLKAARGKITVADIEEMFEKQRKCGFSVPAHGLFLQSVNYPAGYFPL